ncbi:MAG: PAS domain S-box protein, partial [Asgard group archaeon]|nr:PAS domain S-box protein [Asgard group archaeon]
AEEEWDDRQESLRTIFDSLEDLLMIVDANSGQILNVNQKVEELLGYSKKMLLKMTVKEIHPEKTHEMHETLIEAMKKKKNIFNMVLSDSDGKKINFRVTTNPIIYYKRDALIFVLRPIKI